MSADLDCVFCGAGYATFNSLAFHVANDCPNAPARQAPPAAARRSPRRTTKKRASMAKRTVNATDRPDARRNRPGRRAEREQHPRFSLETIGSARDATIKLSEHVTTVDGEFGTSELFLIRYKDETYSFFIRRTSGNFKALKRMFGRDTDRWEGRSVDLTRETFEKDGREIEYLAVVED
jgi:hypothetical protein